MSARVTLATAARVLRQLRHDRRTVALMLFVPCLLVTLLWWVFLDREAAFEGVGGPLVGIFPFTVMFLVTSVATLRERTSGTLERLLTLPVGRGDLIAGYALGFGGVAVVQATLVSALVVGPLGLDVAGPAELLVVVAVLDALLGVALGLGVSAFAATEFQAVQFMPAAVLPQLLLCGLLVPRDQMPGALEAVSGALPLSYAVDAMREVVAAPEPTVATELAIVGGFVVAALAVGATTLRRRTP
ncbi:MAG: ABC transporter permease [Dermatophilaceae bacterium]